MPSDHTAASSSKSKPFKPVRPAARTSEAGPSTTSRPKATTSKPRSQTQSQSQPRKTQSSTARVSNISRRSDPDPDDDEYEAQNNINNHLRDDDGPAPEEDDESARPCIPPQLLTSLLHEFFTDEGMRISKSADRAVGKYMETFVREAVARAAFDRRGAGDDVFGGGGGGLGGFMEVEDLEKLAPQLVLDF